jgi:hypothetical protein
VLTRGAGDNRDARSDATGFAAVGLSVLAVACCASGPLLVAAVSSVALAAVVGIGVGLIAIVALMTMAVVRVRRRSATARPDVTLEKRDRD